MAHHTGKILTLWNDMGLLPRLMLSIVSVILAVGSLRVYLQVVAESAYVREHHQAELRETHSFLEQMLPNYALTGDMIMIQKLLDTQVRERDDIGRIQWQSSFGSLDAQKEGKVQINAPDWFVRLVSVPAEEKTSPIDMDGVSFGTLTLRVDPVQSLNRLWRHLMTQFKMIALLNMMIIILLVLLLRRNLITLRRLSVATIRFRQGDHGVRVDATGSVEIRSAAQAFNRMAEDVELMLQSLAQSERRFRAIFDQTFQFASLVDREGMLMDTNQSALDAAGIKPQDVIGKAFWDTPWWRPEDGPRVRDAVERASRGEFVRFETSFMGPDEMPRLVDFSLKPIREKGREIVWLIAEGRDITHLKQAEAAFLAEKMRAQTTLSSIGDAVITTDKTGRVEYLNPVAEQLTGWTAWDARGHELQEVFNVVSETSRLPLVTHAARALIPGTSIELESNALLHSRTGREIAIEASVSPIRDGDGNVVGCVLVFHDVSEKRRLMQQITLQAGHDASTKLPNPE